jgi:hypothetical protein
MSSTRFDSEFNDDTLDMMNLDWESTQNRIGPAVLILSSSQFITLFEQPLSAVVMGCERLTHIQSQHTPS